MRARNEELVTPIEQIMTPEIHDMYVASNNVIIEKEQSDLGFGSFFLKSVHSIWLWCWVIILHIDVDICEDADHHTFIDDSDLTNLSIPYNIGSKRWREDVENALKV